MAASDAPAVAAAGIATVDELRAGFGLAPLPDGQGDHVAEPAPVVPATPAPLALGRSAPAVRASPAVAPGHAERAAARARLWSVHDSQARTIETQWVRALRRLFRRQEAATLKRVRGQQRGTRLARGTPAEARQRAEDVFDPAFWQNATREEALGLYESVASAGLTRLAAKFGISFDIADPLVDAFINDRANQLAGVVTDTTYRAIQDALAAGVEAGEGVDKLAIRIEAVFDEASSVRAEAIARTEVVSAANGAALEGARSLGPDVASGMVWIATQDDRTRDSHSTADGQVVPIGTQFDVDGVPMGYPGDPAAPPEETIRCRCTVGFLTPEEMAA